MADVNFKREVIFFLLPACLGLALASAGDVPSQARTYLPSKAEFQAMGFPEWVPPWEIKKVEEGYVTFQRAYNSEEEYFAASQLAQLVAGKAGALRQLELLPESDLQEMKEGLQERLADLAEEEISTPFIPFPSLEQRVELDILDLVKKNQFSKQTFIGVYRKRLTPVESAAEITFARIDAVEQDAAPQSARAGRISIRIYMYSPGYVKDHPAEFRYTGEDTAYFEQGLTDYYKSLAQALLRYKGEELEEDLQTLLQTPPEKRQESERTKISDLSDALDALDLLENSSPAVDSDLLPFGDHCLIVRAKYTFPEDKRKNLAKAGGDVATMIFASLKQGSAVAQVELTTNDNAKYSEESMKRLLQFLAQKLQPFRFS